MTQNTDMTIKTTQSLELTTKNSKAAIDALHAALGSSNYLCDRSFTAKIMTALHTRPTAGMFLYGPAGTGKTLLPYTLASLLQADVVFYQCFPGTREDDLTIKLLPNQDSISGISAIDGPIVEASKLTNNPDTKRVFLILDEWDKTRPSADSFLLNFLQYGSIHLNGEKIQADLSKLTVFITMNDERELSEPLLRRLPMLDFQPLSAGLVAEALMRKHGNHTHLVSAILLYQRCLKAKMAKPATIQELSQLLDAIDVLGDDADWDSLVYQYVTKTTENHSKLKSTEKETIDVNQILSIATREKLSINCYQAETPTVTIGTGSTESGKAVLPTIASLRFNSKFDPIKADVDLEQSFGLIKHNNRNYNAIVSLLTDQDASTNPADLKFAEISGRFINLKTPLPLMNFRKYEGLTSNKNLKNESDPGELYFVEPLGTMADLRYLVANNPDIQIVKFTEHEVIAKSATNGQCGKIDYRWTKDAGIEVIFTANHDTYTWVGNQFGFNNNDSIYLYSGIGNLGSIEVRRIMLEIRRKLAASGESIEKIDMRKFYSFPFTSHDPSKPIAPALIKIRKSGLNDPDQKTDCVKVGGTVYLPCEEGSTLLDSRLRLKNRIDFMGGYLTHDTGEPIKIDGRNYRAVNLIATGATWAEASWLAIRIACEQLQKIEDVLVKRAKMFASNEGIEE